MKYRKKPVEIEAVRWNGTAAGAIPIVDWILREGEHAARFYNASADFPYNSIVIDTLEGPIHAAPGDWIIQGVAGEFYPCKPDIFDRTYEFVER